MSDPSKRAEIGLCLMLAAADGQVSEQEIGALSTRLGVILGDDASTAELWGAVEAEIRALDELGPDDYTATLAERIPPERRLSALAGALDVAFADGLAPEEEQTLRETAVALGLHEDEVTSLLTRRA